MSDKKLTGAGLRGQSAGQTALCTVGKSGSGLTYCGYDVADLADNASFEEVAYLLFNGELPNEKDLATYKAELASMRDLPQALKEVLKLIPKSAHPMDVMRTGCSFLGNIEPENDFSEQNKAANRLLSAFPAIMCYWYKFSHDGVEIDCMTDEASLGGHFLRLLNGESPSKQHERVMDVSLILYAEHEFNASTFTARVCASTLSDMFSCVTGAIGTLRGPLHGGANEAAMDMIEKFQSPSDAKIQMAGMLERKEKARLSMTLNIEGQGVTYRIQEPALPPLNPVGLRFFHFVLLGPLVGLCAIIGLTLLYIILDPRIRFPSLLSELDVVTLAVIPHVKTPFTKRILRFDIIVCGILASLIMAAYIGLAYASKVGLI